MFTDNSLTIVQIALTLPACLLLSKLTIFLAEKIGFVNYPNPIVESHKKKTAYGGGVSLAITLITFLIFQSLNNETAVKFILILLPIVAAGLLDDIFKFSPSVKLVSEIIAITPFLLLINYNSFVCISVVILLILFSQNAWNLIDVMDGITSGISIIIFIFMGLILLSINELQFYSNLSFAVAFCTMGLRFYNKAPAKIFLGETGTILLGSIFAIILIQTFQTDRLTALFLTLLGVIPFFEIIFLIIVRTKKGIPFYKGSPDHFSLRMINNGHSVYSINKKVIFICFIDSVIITSVYVLFKSIPALIICVCLSLAGSILAYLYFVSLPAK
jgi:UDP-GlcNAc:undecaprenyl-phosphate GlcNAc-1-phosphate transferase